MMRLLKNALLCLALLLYAFHFAHLRADFPNHSPWMDWAKYTDEGWYGDAAIRFYLRGTWQLPGDFNPGAALPVWPLLEAMVFRFTGVGIVAARALAVVVFGGILVCSYRLLRSKPLPEDRTSVGLLAAASLALMAASPFLYAFTRMAILEPLLILWLLLALLTAHSIHPSHSGYTRLWRLGTVGLLTALMVGTKTTALFLVPSIYCMLCSSSRWRIRQVVRDTAVAALAALLPAAVYFLLLLRGGFLADFRYLFTANAYTAITSATFWPVLWESLRDVLWTGPAIASVALLIAVAAMFRALVWRDAVFTSLLLWTGGYLAYIAYHANFQPRYYVVVAVPLVLLLGRGAMHFTAWKPRTLYLLVPVLLGLTAWEARSTVFYVLHPEYSFQAAVEGIERIVESEPGHSHTVLSISGSNLSLMTGLPSICDDFGTMDLEDRIALYKPGWFVTWNYVEDDKMEALAQFYRLNRVASLPALDDPDRNLMIVYRLDPKEGVSPRRQKLSRRLPAPEVRHGQIEEPADALLTR